MDTTIKTMIWKYIVNRWVSWVIEILIGGTIAFFTIRETQKTAEQTREMLVKYDAAFSQYVAERTQAVDKTVATTVLSAKEKVQSLTIDDLKNVVNALKDSEEK